MMYCNCRVYAIFWVLLVVNFFCLRLCEFKVFVIFSKSHFYVLQTISFCSEVTYSPILESLKTCLKFEVHYNILLIKYCLKSQHEIREYRTSTLTTNYYYYYYYYYNRVLFIQIHAERDKMFFKPALTVFSGSVLRDLFSVNHTFISLILTHPVLWVAPSVSSIDSPLSSTVTPHSFIPAFLSSSYWLHGFPRLFTDTSELIRFYFLVFLFSTF